MLAVLQVIFWLAVGVILYTFLVYPFLLGLLANRFKCPVRQAPITPRVTLLIPAYNEALVIARKLENALALDYPADRLEIVVVTDGSDDGTDSIVAALTARGVRLYHNPRRQGKAAAINRVMPMIDSEVVVFSDANAMLERETMQKLVRNFADLEVGGVAGEKRVLDGGEGLYWRYESYLKGCESAISSVMGAAGELFAIRRELFKPPEPDSLLEDFMISLRLVEAGWRVVYEPEAIATEDISHSLAGEWERRARITAGGFQSISRLTGLLSPARGRVAWQYLSHRVLRWAATPFLVPVVCALNIVLLDLPFYRYILLGQTGFYLLALLGFFLARRGLRHGLPYIAFYFCFTQLAAWAGFGRYIRGSQPVNWSKAR
jgi:poly-beta-1,6-N-acetyl-D-glucosamine synthase